MPKSYKNTSRQIAASFLFNIPTYAVSLNQVFANEKSKALSMEHIPEVQKQVLLSMNCIDKLPCPADKRKRAALAAIDYEP